MSNKLELEELELYAVRNKDGHWFRAKGFSGHGESWVKEIRGAKIYTNIGQARSRVTFFAKNYPTYGVPSIVKLKIGGMEVIDETDRFEKSQIKDRKRILMYTKRKAEIDYNNASKKLEDAKKLLNDAAAKVKLVMNGST
jgi:hypothetical protein